MLNFNLKKLKAELTFRGQEGAKEWVEGFEKELREIKKAYWKNPYAMHQTMIQLLEEILGE